MIISSVSPKTGVEILWSSHSTFSCCQRKAKLQTTCKPVLCDVRFSWDIHFIFPFFFIIVDRTL